MQLRRVLLVASILASTASILLAWSADGAVAGAGAVARGAS